MKSVFSLSLKGLMRRKAYTYLIILTAMIAIATLFTSSFFLNSMKRGLEVGINRLGADVIVVPAEVSAGLGPTFLMGAPSNFYLNISTYEEVTSNPHIIKATYHLYFQTIPLEIKACCTFGNLKVIGFDPETDFVVKVWMKPFESGKSTDEDYLVVGSAIPVSSLTGYQFNLFGEPYIVRGQLEPTGIGYIDSTIFIPMSLARKIINYELFQELAGRTFTGEEISAILIKVDKSENINKVMLEVDKIAGVKAVAMPTLTTSVAGILRSIETSVWPFVILVLVMSVVGITVVFLLSAYVRRREIGILRAIGASKLEIFKMIILESTFLALVGGSIGVSLGAWISWLIQLTSTRLYATLPLLRLPPIEVLMLIVECLSCSLLIGVLSSLYPLYRLLKMGLDDVLRV